MTPSQHQMQIYAFQQQQLQAVAARYGQTQQAQGIMPNGTPGNINAAVRSPMVQNSQLTGNVARSSPLSGNTPQASRSPMPPAQQPGVGAGQHPQQAATVQQMQPQPMYNFANQYNMARMMPQNPSTLAAMHAMQAQQAQAQQQAQQQAQTQTQSQQSAQNPQMQAATPEQQQQAQAHAHAQALQMMSGYPMFNMNYAAQMGVPMQGRLPPTYQWTTTMGFRRPVNGMNGMNVQVNGQTAQMQAARAQQMQRAMQGSVQGR